MRKHLICLIIILSILLSKESMSIKCLNNYCECNQRLEDNTTYNVECTSSSSESITKNEQTNDIKRINNLKIKNKLTIESIINNSSIIEIKSLDLSFNELNNIDININIFESITKLNLSYNQLLILKENQFSKLNKLEILDLSYNELFYIELKGSRQNIEIIINRNLLINRIHLFL
jgi:hypothetical protein